MVLLHWIMEAVDRISPEASVLGGRLSPLGWSVGFLEAPIEPASESLLAWRTGLGVPYEVSRSEAPWPECLLPLEPLETPWTREVVASHGAAWTACLNNDIGGGDPFPATSYLAKLLGVRWVIATHQPMTSYGHASTQLWLGGPHGEPPLDHVRTIAAHAEDRRWSWETSGQVQDFERPAAYRTRKISERFTRPLLLEYVQALGIAVDDNAQYGDAVMVKRRTAWRPWRRSHRFTRR
ncbi:hypothetical protein [Actinoplanes sp. HUAS TT8]|uniref:hypothetical protein n=1 Tax=Actinoplanes sp. HUAS TT8 TaxID=3447453 RepID=UPI003F52097F